MAKMSIQPRLKRLVQKKAALSLFFSDGLMLVAAFFIARVSSAFVSDFLVPGEQKNFSFDRAQLEDFSFLFLTPVVLVILYLKGHYTQRVPWWQQVRYLFLSFLLAFFVENFIRMGLDFPFWDQLVTVAWAYGFLLILVGRQIVFYCMKYIHSWDVGAIAVGGVDTVTDILYALNADKYVGYNVKHVILRDRKDRVFDLTAVPKKYEAINVDKDCADYVDFISKNLDHVFIICLETFRGEERDKLIEKLVEMKAMYMAVPPTSRMSLSEMKPQHFFGSDVMMLHSKNNISSLLGRFLKRTMDIVIALSALIVLAPVFVVVALSLKVEGQGGSVFYGGYRLGRKGQLFKCWKFRSMEPDSDHLLYELLESNPQIKEDFEKYMKLKVHDPRVTTKTARLIRMASLDELPQLWNVLIGDMSIVGPRPVLEREQDLMGASYANYIKTRPGITGLWQVSGRNDTSFQRRLHMDDWYIRNWSIWGDVVIIVKTISVVFRRTGSY